jgi:hypothetical protein
VKLKIDFSLSKRTRVRLALRLGLTEGAAVDVRLRLPGREPVRWKAALAPDGGKPALESPHKARRDHAPARAADEPEAAAPVDPTAAPLRHT